MGNNFVLEPHIRLRNLNHNQIQLAASNPETLEDEFEIMFGGPPVSFQHYLEGPNVSYIPRSRADENTEPTPIKVRSTVKIQNQLDINKNSIILYSFEEEEQQQDIGEEIEQEIYSPLNNNESSSQSKTKNKNLTMFGLEFDFDCTIDCELHVYFFAKEKKNQRLNYYHFNAEKHIGPIFFKSGMKHHYRLPDEFALPLSQLDQGSLIYNEEYRNMYPIVLELRSTDFNRKPSDASFHFTYLAFEKSNLSSNASAYSIKLLKQKIQQRGQAFILADVYANLMDSSATSPQQDATKNTNTTVEIGEESEENNLCVICITDIADSCILPCRHCCLCTTCSKALKQQSNKCPICRANIDSFIRLPRAEDGTLLEVDATLETQQPENNNKPSGDEAV